MTYQTKFCPKFDALTIYFCSNFVFLQTWGCRTPPPPPPPIYYARVVNTTKSLQRLLTVYEDHKLECLKNWLSLEYKGVRQGKNISDFALKYTLWKVQVRLCSLACCMILMITYPMKILYNKNLFQRHYEFHEIISTN